MNNDGEPNETSGDNEWGSIVIEKQKKPVQQLTFFFFFFLYKNQ